MKTNIIKAIIADDEERCVANLKYYLSKYCPLIEIAATSTNLQEVKHLLKIHKPEIAFLDIEMCNDNIFSVINEEKTHPEIVFVTAYEKYAVKAIKVSALDYILKPLSKSDILDCYRKILRQVQGKLAIEQPGNGHDKLTSKKVILKHGEHVFIVKQEDIFYCRAKGFYTEVYFDFKGNILSTLVSKPISSVEKDYDEKVFFRVHKSYLINTGKVIDILKGETTTVKMGNNQLVPVAKRRVNDFLLFLNKTN